MRGGSEVIRLALACALASTAALADTVVEKHPFDRCDNLRAPGSSVDGLSIAAEDSRTYYYDAKAAAQHILDSCTLALASPKLKPEQAYRRVNLLRAKALAELELDQVDAALADLDAAEAAGAPLESDLSYHRSLGLSLTLVRAVALHIKGQDEQARSLAAQAAAQRPYSQSIQTVAAAIIQASRPIKGDSPYLALVPLNPDAMIPLFATLIKQGSFEAAASVYPRLHLAYPKLDAPVTQGAGQVAILVNATELARSIVFSAQAAYALAATGKPGEAKALLERNKQKAAEAMVIAAPTTPSATPPGLPTPAVVVEQLTKLQALWGSFAEARIALAEHRPTEALKAIVGKELPPSAIAVDLTTALRTALPADQRSLAPDIEPLTKQLDADRHAEKLNIAALRQAMPTPELSSRMASYAQAAPGFFVGFLGASAEGFKSKTDDATGVTKVEFLGELTSAPAVEELTLLRAADLARAAGKPALLIQGRRDYRRTLTTYSGMGHIPIASRPAGYKTELDVRFVDPKALPPEIAGDKDRLLDANAIYDRLAPIYLAKPAAPAPVH